MFLLDPWSGLVYSSCTMYIVWLCSQDFLLKFLSRYFFPLSYGKIRKLRVRFIFRYISNVGSINQLLQVISELQKLNEFWEQTIYVLYILALNSIRMFNNVHVTIYSFRRERKANVWKALTKLLIVINCENGEKDLCQFKLFNVDLGDQTNVLYV